MSEVTHALYIYNPTGIFIDVITEARLVSLAYGFSDSAVGALEFDVTMDEDPKLFGIDNIIEVYQIINGDSHLEGETAFLIRKAEVVQTDNGSKVRHILAYSALEIIMRHIVAYPAESSYAEKYKPWDNMIREFVYENFGPGASYAGVPARNIEPWLRTEADKTAGASYYKAAAWRNVYEVLRDITQDVRANGTYATFDVVRVGLARFEFRVYIGARGIDHSMASPIPVIVSEEFHNLANASASDDWTEERNYIYATGQGQADERIVQEASDTARIRISPFGRRELQVDARQVSTTGGVLAEANAALESSRPRKLFTGTIVQTEECIYGIHWDWGDIVVVQFDGDAFDCHISAVTVRKESSGAYTVTGQLRSVEDV